MTSQIVFSIPRRPGQPVWLRRLITGLLLAALPFWGILSGLAQPVSARPDNKHHEIFGTSVVISEFRMRGPNGVDDEFIEIFNPTIAAIDISNWKLRNSNNAGVLSDTFQFPALPTPTILQPGQYFLVVNNLVPGYSGSATPNGTYGVGIADDGGLALTLADNTIIDQVGMSTGSGYKEGTVLPPLLTDVNRSYARNSGSTASVCEDNNNNVGDFAIVAPSQPQNLTSLVTLCRYLPLSLVINEVAWSGTQTDGSMGQWIELYNPGTSDILIDGWHLIAADGVPDIPLSGSIDPGEYILLARRSDAFQFPSPPFTIPPEIQVFSDSLSSNGESLSLFTKFGELVDTANADGGPWPAGNGFVPYRSMERNGISLDSDNIWITFDGTPTVRDRGGNFINGSPGLPNWADGMTKPTSTPTSTKTVTLTPTVTSTRTITLTPTVTSTRTLTPTKTLTPLHSPTRTQTATATKIPPMELVINEVAWMGTSSTNPNDEWIELYNPGTDSVNLAGWRLVAKDGSPDILLDSSKSIPAGGYYLLERAVAPDDDVVSNILADQIYNTGILSNTTETLQLFSPPSPLFPTGELVDIANGNGGAWPAGSASTYCSMERSGPKVVDSDTTWFTSTGVTKNGEDRAAIKICGSPKYRNWAYDVTPTATRPPASITPTRTNTRAPTSTPNRATPEPIILNEFLSQPRSDWNNDGKVDSGDGFIELKNLSTQSMSISGFRLDDQEGGSLPYTIQSVTMQPGTRKVFFASETGILLSSGGDSVRLYKPSGSLPSDAYTYNVIMIPDQTWCRLPDDPKSYFALKWNFGCEPTLGEANKLAESVIVGNRVEAAMCLSKNLPPAVYLAECDPLGLEMWSPALWDALLPDFPRFFELDKQEYILE